MEVPHQKLQLFSPEKLEVMLLRLCHQLIENHRDFKDTVMVGIQPRGVFLGRRLNALLQDLLPGLELPYGDLDVTFQRDDLRRHKAPLVPNQTKIDFLVEDKKVILVDDVLYTGRTIRAALDGLLAFGRPRSVELLVLVDRKRKRELPIESMYVGVEVDTLDTETVIVRLKESGGEDTIRLETR